MKTLIERFKTWWIKKTKNKCDYCEELIDVYYDAYLFPVEEYKGNCICIDCIKKLNKEHGTIIFQ